MGLYRVGQWTASTLATLSHLYQQNRSGKRPRYAQLPTRTMQHWSSPLKAAGYLVDHDGLLLTPKGHELLASLQRSTTSSTHPVAASTTARSAAPASIARPPPSVVSAAHAIPTAKANLPAITPTPLAPRPLVLPKGSTTLTLQGPSFAYQTSIPASQARDLLRVLITANTNPLKAHAAPRRPSRSHHAHPSRSRHTRAPPKKRKT